MSTRTYPGMTDLSIPVRWHRDCFSWSGFASGRERSVSEKGNVFQGRDAMMLLTLVMWAAQQGPGDGKAEVKGELDRFKGAIRSASEAARISAIQSLSVSARTEVLGPLASLLTGDSEGVRVAAARALGGMDHPKAVEVL